jgi:hypothetical protein
MMASIRLAMAGKGVVPPESPARDRHNRAATTKLRDDLGIGFDTIGREECAVFDAVHAGSHGIGNALAPVSVRRDWEPCGVRCGDGGENLIDGVLRFVRADGGSHVAARGHDLDDVDTPTRPITHSLADAVGAVGFASQEPAMTAGDRDRGTRRQDLRPGLCARAEPIPQRQRDVVTVSEIADRGHATRNRPQRSNAHPQQQRRIVVLEQAGHRIVRRIERQVLVHIDQAWQQRHIAKVDEVGVVCRGSTLCHFDDLAVQHFNERVFHDRLTAAVKQSPCRDQHRTTSLPSPSQEPRTDCPIAREPDSARDRQFWRGRRLPRLGHRGMAQVRRRRV